MPKSTYLRNAVLSEALRNVNYVPPATVYVSLHTADPGATGLNEVAGGGYARQAGTFDAPVGGVTQNSATLTFTNMPTVTVTHGGVWDASTNGNLLYYGPLTASRSITAGDSAILNAGTLTVTEA